MGLQIAPAEEAPRRDRHSLTDTHLRGRWLIIARATWVALLALNLWVFVASAPARFAHGQTGDFTSEVALLLVYAAIAVVLFWRKSDDRMAVFASIFLVTWGATASPTWDALESHPAWFLPVRFLRTLGPTLLLIFLYLFPDGRFIPRWTRALAVVVVGLTVATQLFGPLTLPDPFSFLLWIGFLGSGVVAQIYRYRRVSGPAQRQQTKWVVFGVTAMSLGLLGAALPGAIFPSLNQSGDQQGLYELISGLIAVFSLLLFPLSIGIAILHYRLWDIDIIINRTLVYGALSASIAGIYVLVVGALGALFQARGDLAISLIATALVALLFQPLRERLQRGVNRLMYGERDDPYAVLARLGQRLEVTLASDAVLPTIVETVAQALKLPYVAIAFRVDERRTMNPGLSGNEGDERWTHDDVSPFVLPPSAAAFKVVASSGIPVLNSLCMQLVYQNEMVGQLLLAPRASNEAFSLADRRLLEDLARQAGIAVHAVRLTRDLQQSRERLVTTREEERRRLRRDLHDGLGPTLAGFTLKVAAIRNLLTRDQAAADGLLAELGGEIEAAVGDIRRLVYDLRPPALDEFGLTGAIRARAVQYSANTTDGLQVRVEAPSELPPLPAAVEVAAYRIIQEALANVVRHAKARTCVVRLAVDDMLRLEIRDDGIGLATEHHLGVGQLSMRERARELGGICVVEPISAGGTCVRACLPLGQE
jgi:signal transduction histidine kinase